MSDTRQRDVERSRAVDPSLLVRIDPAADAPVVPLELRPARPGTLIGRFAPKFRSGANRTPWLTRLLSGRGMLTSFLLFVALPSVIVGLYLVFIMSDEYMAESQFVVRGAVQKNTGDSGSPIGALTGFSGSNQDSYVLTDFIRSSAMVEHLQKTLTLSDLYSGSEIDWVSRFDATQSKEKLQKYWQRMTRVSTENLSGIVTLKVWAYTPADALKISQAVLDASEGLVNKISQRGRSDAMTFAQAEVDRAETRMKRAMVTLKAFMDENQIVDPTKQLEGSLGILSDLTKKQIEASIRLEIASRSMQADSPVVRDLRSQKSSLDNQIAALQATLTRAARSDTDPTHPASGGSEAAPASTTLMAFEGLQIDRMFAEKAYQLANVSYDVARQQADAQQVYVSVFSPPSLPQHALYPLPLGGTAIAFAGCFLVWSVVTLVMAAVNDHRI